MRRINLYIVRHLTIGTVLTTVSLVFAIWLTQSLRLIEVLTDGQAPFGTFLRLVGLSLPNFLSIVLPIAFAGSVLFVYHRLLTDNELVILRATGMAPSQVARPAVITAIVVSAIVASTNLYFLPLANQEFRLLRDLVQSQFASALLREGQFNELDGRTVYFRERTPAGELHGILYYDNTDPTQPETIIAERGLLVETETGPVAIVFNGLVQRADAETGQIDTLYFDQHTEPLQEEQPVYSSSWLDPRSRFIGDLLYPDMDNPSDAANAARLITLGHQRLAGPLLPIAFTLVALGALFYGDYNRRGAGIRLLAAVICIVLVQANEQMIAGMMRTDIGLFPALYASPLIASALGIAMMYRRRPLRYLFDLRPAARSGAA